MYYCSLRAHDDLLSCEVSIELPQLVDMADVDLEVSEMSLSLKAGTAYKLELPLKHRVDDENVQAKFDKRGRKLVVSMPVVY